MAPKISIVIPVYNGEKFLVQTLESLLNQSFKDFELICINDASTDNSLEILNKFSGKINMKIVALKNNVGLVPFIMKTYGLPNIRGEYFMYMSQDDFLSLDCLENMYMTAIKLNADAVIPDFIFFNNESSERKIIGVNGNREIILKGEDAFVLSLDWKIPGSAIWSSELVKRLGYEDFNMYADEYTVRKFFLECKMVAFCPGEFYYRTDNPEAITRKMKPALFSKVFKEAKLLELVYHNSELSVYTARMEKLINMFYDYHQILFNQNFNRLEKMEAKENLKMAFLHFNKFLTSTSVTIGRNNKILFLKYHILRSNYLFFYLFCRLKFFLTSIKAKLF